MAGISWLSCNRTRCDKDSVNSVESPPRASGEGCQSRAGMESPVELRSLPRRPRVDGFECFPDDSAGPGQQSRPFGGFFCLRFFIQNAPYAVRFAAACGLPNTYARSYGGACVSGARKGSRGNHSWRRNDEGERRTVVGTMKANSSTTKRTQRRQEDRTTSARMVSSF